jgi:1-acyl-sn-glycerol-3-phosphate acyltransferase
VTDQLTPLTQINLDDLVSLFGWQDYLFLAAILRRTFAAPARKFAQQMIDFDNAVGQVGLAEASRCTLQNQYVRDVHVFGGENIPSSGPILVLSNHPGMTDTVSLFAALKRRDLKIIALNRPFLMALPNISKQLFYLEDNPTSRMALVRRVSAHLRAGGAALTFPAGRIEPDANVYEGAVESLGSWTNSVGVFVRMAAETAILPVLVRGVIWEKMARSKLLAFKRVREDREKLIAALQLLGMVMFDKKPVTVTIQIGKPITAKELGTMETQVIHQAVLEEMKCLVEHAPQGAGEPVL